MSNSIFTKDGTAQGVAKQGTLKHRINGNIQADNS